MTTPGENLEKYQTPQARTFDSGSDMLPINAVVHSPFVISDWRADQYLNAVAAVLPEDTTTEQLKALKLGSHWAANRSSSYYPYQDSAPRSTIDRGSELTKEESEVLRLIGADTFLEIQRTAPPEELVDYMLSGGTSPYVRPDLSQITVAVIKGQLPWEERFEAAGVPRPEEYINEITVEADRYRAVLREYEMPQSRQPSRFMAALGKVAEKLSFKS
jgi:hypothetical protein